MAKRWLWAALVLFLVINLAGCAELRRKFIRKTEPRKAERLFYRVEDYKTAPSHERYMEHYVLWHNWQLDLERTESTSHLRDLNAANEALKHLTAMRDLLVEEKAKALDIEVGHMNEILAFLKDNRRDVMEDTKSRRTIERMGRVIVNNYSYNRMKKYIKSE